MGVGGGGDKAGRHMKGTERLLQERGGKRKVGSGRIKSASGYAG